MCFIRRIASVLFALAFIVSTQAYARAAMPMANGDMAMSAMMSGSKASDCNGCNQGDLMAKADCKATCVPVMALTLDCQVAEQGHMYVASMWKADRATTHETAPDTAPPRS
jgi:hypothetical protein